MSFIPSTYVLLCMRLLPSLPPSIAPWLILAEKDKQPLTPVDLTDWASPTDFSAVSTASRNPNKPSQTDKQKGTDRLSKKAFDRGFHHWKLRRKQTIDWAEISLLTRRHCPPILYYILYRYIGAAALVVELSLLEKGSESQVRQGSIALHKICKLLHADCSTCAGPNCHFCQYIRTYAHTYSTVRPSEFTYQIPEDSRDPRRSQRYSLESNQPLKPTVYPLVELLPCRSFSHAPLPPLIRILCLDQREVFAAH